MICMHAAQIQAEPFPKISKPGHDHVIANCAIVFAGNLDQAENCHTNQRP